MGTLQAALAWAERGFSVFPLTPRHKTPIHDDWPSVATTDLDTIRRMWTDPVLRTEREYNIGVLCSDMVVVDVDTKFGKDGHNEYMQMGGTYDTLVVRTPSGGFHCYFEGPDSGNAPISNGVDIRSHRGFVVAPGSILDDVPGEQVGGVYEVVTDRAPAFVPLDIERRLAPVLSRREGAVSEALDTPQAVQAAINFLRSAPPAIEGQGGDNTTFQTAARVVRELAISEALAFDLLAEHWNPRCQPPWNLDELRVKVENAAQYGTADMGRLDPTIAFRGVAIPQAQTVFQQARSSFGNAMSAETIPPRPWMIDRILMLQDLTMVLAPGSAGKSSLVLAIAAHLAVGKDFGPNKTHTRCRSIIYNGEDDLREQSRRLYAVCQAYALDYAEVASNILLLSADTTPLVFVQSEGRKPVINTELVRQLIDLAADPQVGMIALDPLVDVHEVDEGDNPMMNAVMRTLKQIAKEANVAAIVAHHTSKAGSSKQEDRVGNMDISRGASGIVFKARIAFTLLNASATDCEDYGIQDHDRDSWVRLDDAKMQYHKAGDQGALWFRKVGVHIPSGDVVGALQIAELKRDTMHIRMMVADAIMNTMEANANASMTVSQAVAVVKTEVPLWNNKTDTDVRKRIEGMFSTEVEVRGRRLHAIRDGEGAKAALVLTMK